METLLVTGAEDPQVSNSREGGRRLICLFLWRGDRGMRWPTHNENRKNENRARKAVKANSSGTAELS